MLRYATTGKRPANNSTHVINHHKWRMALAHNGNLTKLLRAEILSGENGYIFHTTTDIEVIAYIIVQGVFTLLSIDELYMKLWPIEGHIRWFISSPTKLSPPRSARFRPLAWERQPNGNSCSIGDLRLTPSEPILSVMCARVRSIGQPQRDSRRTSVAAAVTKTPLRV